MGHLYDDIFFENMNKDELFFYYIYSYFLKFPVGLITSSLQGSFFEIVTVFSFIPDSLIVCYFYLKLKKLSGIE